MEEDRVDKGINKKWGLNSWRGFKISQQPNWENHEYLSGAIDELSKLPALVFSGETRNLRRDLKKVSEGKKFILQVGNCVESFEECRGPFIHDFVRIILQMSIVIESLCGKEVVKIGRIAGQYAKPRTNNFEDINGEKILAYRGDIINDYFPSKEGRNPDPRRMLEAYFRSASTLNLIRAFTQGGYTDIKNTQDWKKHPLLKKFFQMKGFSLSPEIKSKNFHLQDNIYISHECLLLDYEEPFVRVDTTTGGWYSTSAHSLWIGDRTRNSNEAHIEFVSGINNPIGIKIGPEYELQDVIESINKVNPDNEDDKLMIICRMGVDRILTDLAPLIEEISRLNINVIWCCDPMHGNTKLINGHKTRYFDDIQTEIELFFQICRNYQIIPGGIHLELTSEDVTECLGGFIPVSDVDIHKNYKSKVDPRLNASQAVEISLAIGNFIQKLN